jgi:hypothetical protein
LTPTFFKHFLGKIVGRKSHEKGAQLIIELCKGKFLNQKVGLSGAQLPLNTINRPLVNMKSYIVDHLQASAGPENGKINMTFFKNNPLPAPG